jgi:uncharacterized membrane protein YqjE
MATQESNLARASEPHGERLRDESVSDLLRQLATETSTLVRQELALAKAEMSEKGKQAGRGAAMVSAAGVVTLLALGAFTACLIVVLDSAMALWLAALLVAVVYGGVAAVLALTGKNRLKEAAPPVPEQTERSVKEDVEWAKTRARSART